MNKNINLTQDELLLLIDLLHEEQERRTADDSSSRYIDDLIEQMLEKLLGEAYL